MHFFPLSEQLTSDRLWPWFGFIRLESQGLEVLGCEGLNQMKSSDLRRTWGAEGFFFEKFESGSCSVVSDSLWPHELYSPWNLPGQNTEVGSLSLLQGIFPNQGPNQALPQQCRWILYQLSHKGSPEKVKRRREVCPTDGSNFRGLFVCLF